MRIVLLILFAASPAFGWWCEGHEMVAFIAEKHLTPHALAASTQLLKAQPVDPSVPHFCKDSSNDPLADASTWADDVKKEEQTGSWHYMDIPLGLKHGDVEAYCQPAGPSVNGGPRTGCILSALRYNLNILHDDKESDAEKAKALRYLIHLMGDLHQPLHTTANNDQGGNCVPIQFFSEPKLANLHSVWDGMIVNRDMAAKGRSVEQMAADLDLQYRSQSNGWTKHGPEFERWAWEGHKIAQNVTYGDLQPRIPVEPYEAHPDCKAETEKDGALHLRAGEEYQRRTAPVAEEQIAKAGFRLAEILNEVWP